MLTRIAQVIVFFLELAMLASVGFCGYRIGNAPWSRWIMAIALPVLFILLWGIWAAPKSTRKLPPPSRIIFRLSLFLIAFGLLAFCGHPVAGGTLFFLAALAEWIGGTSKI